MHMDLLKNVFSVSSFRY